MSYLDLFFPLLKRRDYYQPHRKHKGYRQQIREDCLGRCVYCDLHEIELGGDEHMTIDHFRPRGLPQFQHLENDPTNLVWSCHPCNSRKDRNWPAIGTPGTHKTSEGFLDPFLDDRRDYFAVERTGQLRPLRDPATWMIWMLRLNRAGASAIRKKRIIAFEARQEAIERFDSQRRRRDEVLEKPSLTDSDRESLRELEDNINFLEQMIANWALVQFDVTP